MALYVSMVVWLRVFLASLLVLIYILSPLNTWEMFLDTRIFPCHTLYFSKEDEPIAD